jgi:hypothetical protein
MTYQFVYSKRAERDIDKLDAATQKRIKKKLEEFKLDPFRYAEKLKQFRPGRVSIVFVSAIIASFLMSVARISLSCVLDTVVRFIVEPGCFSVLTPLAQKFISYKDKTNRTPSSMRCI